MRNIVAVYIDEGVGQRAANFVPRALAEVLTPQGFSIRVLSAEAVAKGAWQDECALFVMPGGADLPYCRKLKGHGIAYIEAYVRNGGRYLGLCAGAYFASTSVAFDVGGINEICGARELKFYPGEARGPAYSFNGQHYTGDISFDRIAQIEIEKGKGLGASCTIPVCFNAGCFFVDAEKFSNVEILARYGDLPEKPAAIVRCRYGEGVALLCGVHPEYSKDELWSLLLRNATLRVAS
jgi:biotin--protein ligase